MSETVLPLAAVEAMCNDGRILWLMRTNEPRISIRSIAHEEPDGSSPDWIAAALNCTDDAEILPMAIHTFLMDWKPPEEEPCKHTNVSFKQDWSGFYCVDCGIEVPGTKEDWKEE